MKVNCEVAGDDRNCSKTCILMLKVAINEIDETAHQILSFDGTELFWKRPSERIYTSKEEKTMQTFKAV